MSTQLPDFEARLRAQEQTTTMLYTRIEKLSQDMTASFQQLVKYQAATEHELDIHLRHIDARLDRLETHTATKEDLAALENRMGTLEQRFTSLENKTDQRFISLDTKLDSILQLLTVLTRKLL
ncbi:MAG TPA: hypothetical protein VFB60_02235 [Ktedonobacteraceae bacterium]|nr:hypothetical protein [Ktedonobacteraceae bacterium]